MNPTSFQIGDYVTIDGTDPGVVIVAGGAPALVAHVSKRGRAPGSILVQQIDDSRLSARAAPADLEVGDGVSLYGISGEVTAVDPVTHVHTVAVERRLCSGLEVTNNHEVERWRIEILQGS